MSASLGWQADDERTLSARVIVSSHQPAYLPWLAYFDKVLRSDVFVMNDVAQFERRGWINRNYVLTANGPLLLTVPVHSPGHMDKSIADVQVADQRWRHKHLETIRQTYTGATYFDVLFPELERLYAVEHTTIAGLCWDHLRFWLEWMGAEKLVVRSGTLGVLGKGSQRLLGVCRALGATHYISGPLGRAYIDESSFAEAGIEIEYQDYEHPVYPQRRGEAFTPGMGIVDFCMMSDDYGLITSRRPRTNASAA